MCGKGILYQLLQDNIISKKLVSRRNYTDIFKITTVII